MVIDKKYSFKNSYKELEISEEYLGWKPSSFENWDDWRKNTVLSPSENILESLRDRNPHIVNMVHPDSPRVVSLYVFVEITKEDFPVSFLAEERSEHWSNFLIVSYIKPQKEQFIIPMH